MNSSIKKVVPLKNYQLHLFFTNGEEGNFDMKPWLNKSIFSP